MKKIGIICAMDNEFALIKQTLAHGRTAQIGRCTFYCAEYAGKDIIAATGGIGKVNAALHTQMLIDQYGVDRLLHTGVAGAVAPAVKPMDLVIGRTLCYHDVPAELQKLMTPSQLFYESSTALV